MTVYDLVSGREDNVVSCFALVMEGEGGGRCTTGTGVDEGGLGRFEWSVGGGGRCWIFRNYQELIVSWKPVCWKLRNASGK